MHVMAEHASIDRIEGTVSITIMVRNVNTLLSILDPPHGMSIGNRGLEGHYN